MKSGHYSDYTNYRDALLAFMELAREHGLFAGIGDVLRALDLSSNPRLRDPDFVRYGLRALVCTCKDELQVFDTLYARFWNAHGPPVESRVQKRGTTNITRKGKSSVVLLGEGRTEESEKDSNTVSGANKAETLRDTDFSQLNQVEAQLLEELANRLWREMGMRIQRRQKVRRNGSRVDIRRSIRKNISKGGEIIDLVKVKRVPRKQRLVVLLDVSGSMDKYSFFLLRFIWALRSHFEHIESFLFSTRIVRATEILDKPKLETSLELLAAQARHWSSGTKIGDCFRQFNELYAKRVLNGRSTVIILSDGLDTGQPELLSKELRSIRLRTRRVIWLNPLKAMKGYEPIQKGMSAALDDIDTFRSAHSLNSLLDLEEFLMAI